MRITNIISSIANGFVRFGAAANDVLRAFAQGDLCLQHPCAGYPVSYASTAQSQHTGSTGTADQSQFRTLNMVWLNRMQPAMDVNMTCLFAKAESGSKPEQNGWTQQDTSRTSDRPRLR